jgi:hypothetical protein
MKWQLILNLKVMKAMCKTKLFGQWHYGFCGVIAPVQGDGWSCGLEWTPRVCSGDNYLAYHVKNHLLGWVFGHTFRNINELYTQFAGAL